MLALWSRAARPPGTCRCISCAKSVASRGALGGLRRWGMFGPGPTSTFAYTTIFAAGLTIDARAKAERNAQWELAFAHLRDALDHAQSGKSTGEKRTQLPSVSKDAYTAPAPAQGVSTSQTNTKYVPLDARDPAGSQPEWPVSTGLGLIRHNLPPQSLWAPDVTRLSSMRRRHTWKKLALQEVSTALLVHDLLRKINLARFKKTLSTPLQNLSPVLSTFVSYTELESNDVRQRYLENMERIQNTPVNSSVEMIDNARKPTGVPGVPNYNQDADGDYHNICQQMNRSIKHLMNLADLANDKDRAHTVAKICHNLLVSNASPDVQTFNVLLAGFTKWRVPELLDCVIASLHASKIRINESTCRLILQHYTTQSRPDDFSLFVARMRGVKGALMLANPTTRVNDASEGRLTRDEIRPDKIYQKVYPTPGVFAALIAGVMKFAGFDRALDIYYELKRDGWGLSVHDLTKLLADCVRRIDWEGGTYIWEEIRSISHRAKRADMARAYHHMLSLCSITRNTVAFNQVLNEVVRRGHDRQAILAAAMKTTKFAHSQRDYSAPAWAADNLMIAVSGFMGDSSDVNGPDDIWNSILDKDGNPDDAVVPVEQTPTSDNVNDPITITDPKEAWSSWVEHEFGERPKDPEL